MRRLMVARRRVVSRSDTLWVNWRSGRKPRCEGWQNFWAKGAKIVLSREATMRLSVLTTESGRVFLGV